MMQPEKIIRIALVGGTHGNEHTGAALVQLFKQQPLSPDFPTLHIKYVLANPKAFQAGRRCIDQDLNRSFFRHDLANETLQGYEHIQAKNIHRLLGPKENPQTDLIIDLHSSTANMGSTMILVGSTPLQLEIAAFLQGRFHDLHIYHIPKKVYHPAGDQPFLPSVAREGFSFELGPIAHNLVRHDLLERGRQLVLASLEYLERRNTGERVTLPQTIQVFRHVREVSYPVQEEGGPAGVIHKELQDRDYLPLAPGAPIFQLYSGQTVYYEGEKNLYPIFINEASYYPANTAFILTRKTVLHLPAPMQ